jgi:hypothetical protein
LFRDFSGDALLSDTLKPTLVTAFDLTMGQPFFFTEFKKKAKCGEVLKVRPRDCFVISADE